MAERGTGKIINICSMMGEVGRETVSAYTAAKGRLKKLKTLQIRALLSINSSNPNCKSDRIQSVEVDVVDVVEAENTTAVFFLFSIAVLGVFIWEMRSNCSSRSDNALYLKMRLTR